MAKVGSTKKKDATFVSGRLLIARGFFEAHVTATLLPTQVTWNRARLWGSYERRQRPQVRTTEAKKGRRSVSPVQTEGADLARGDSWLDLGLAYYQFVSPPSFP